MGSINRSHIEPDGGLLLFNGELILLYCDSVSCEIGGKESFKGRVYLTTHRLVVIKHPFSGNAPVKSFCAPFCAITKCGVEQPIFGANYIEATVRDEADPSKSFSFKLKFSKGGAIELAMAMNRACQAVGRTYNPTMSPPAYTPSPSAQYYQAPPTVYAPGYNSGVAMPTQQFPEQPPIGFIYASDAPPPYPGLSTQVGGGGAAGGYVGSSHQGPIPPGYPSGNNPQQPGGYPPSSGYPGQQQQQPWSGYPGQQQHPQNPPSQQSWGSCPNQSPQQPPPAGVYPGGAPGGAPPSVGYPDLSNQDSSGGYPGQQPQQQQYPQHSQQPQQQQGESSQQSWPSAPSYNPNWQEDKKNV